MPAGGGVVVVVVVIVPPGGVVGVPVIVPAGGALIVPDGGVVVVVVVSAPIIPALGARESSAIALLGLKPNKTPEINMVLVKLNLFITIILFCQLRR